MSMSMGVKIICIALPCYYNIRKNNNIFFTFKCIAVPLHGVTCISTYLTIYFPI